MDMWVRGRRFVRAVVPSVLGAAVLLLLQVGPAAATVTGPCTAELNGTPVTAGHDTAGTAVHVDYRTNPQYQGEATGGQTVGGIKVAIQIAGFDIRRHGGSTNGPKWSDTVDVKKHAWMGIGLYRVSGVATDDAGAPICTGNAFMCVDGKSPVLTAVGVLAVASGVVALYLLVRGLMGSRRRSRLRVASRLGGAGALGGLAAPLLLQQSCVLPLSRTVLVAGVGGGLVVMTLIGFLIGGRGSGRGRERPREPQPISAAATPPPGRAQVDRNVYHFVPPDDACAACREHAAHRTYRTAEAAEGDRVHQGCHCEIVGEIPKDPFLMARFTGDVLDDREG
jgi:hypothetical protein